LRPAHENREDVSVADWITVREAAGILGVHMSAVPKMIRRGDLARRERRPILNRADVIALRDARRTGAEMRAKPRAGAMPPDDEHEWLSARQAGSLMGVGAAAVSIRARRGRLPSVKHDGRRWFRRDHLELVKRADEVRRGGGLH
jgi:hypothetical protein